MIPQTFTVTCNICFYFLFFSVLQFYLLVPCSRLSWLMSASGRTLKQHLVSYRELGCTVVVRERGGTPFPQIFWSRNGAPANIVGHRWNANTEAFRQITSYSLGWPSIGLFSGPNCPQTRDLASKISLKYSGGDTPDPLSAKGRGRCWDLGLGNRSPQMKLYHYTLIVNCASAGLWTGV